MNSVPIALAKGGGTALPICEIRILRYLKLYLNLYIPGDTSP